MVQISCQACQTTTRAAWDSGGWRACGQCGVLQRLEVPDEEDLHRFYENAWSSTESWQLGQGGTGSALADIYVRRLVRSLARQDLRNLRIADFGAGRGEMLRALREHGAEAVGIDPFSWRFLQQQGCEAVASFDALDGNGRFDGIVALDVIEHVTDPLQMLQELKSHLKPGGWAYVATPNAAGLQARLRRGRWREAQRPGHVILFSPLALRRLLQKAGFDGAKRLRWLVPYASQPAKRVLHYGLQAAWVDGELRYLAWNRD